MKPVVELTDVHVNFDGLQALDGVSLAIERGSTVGIVGESGCGKSTLARVIVGLQSPSAGEARVNGEPAHVGRGRPQVQMVFQDPASSLNPRMKVGAVLRELLAAHGLARGEAAALRTRELIELVGLPARTLDARPAALSGGQRQRVAIARALAVEPAVLVADEAVAALDVSVQATIINLLHDLQRELDLTLLFITHDLGVVRALCEQIVVMYLGRIVEHGPADALLTQPAHPYTRALLAAVPRIQASRRRPVAIARGELPSPYDVPAGCRFHPRCPVAIPICTSLDPPLTPVTDQHVAACVHVGADEQAR